MLRFSVVHSPVGPKKGPGLDEDLQEPFIEEKHMYVGPGAFDWWKNYDQPGDQDYRQEKTKPKKRSKKAAPVVMFDYDGCITADPRTFKAMIDWVEKEGGKACLVTGRPYTDKPEVRAYLEQYGLRFSEQHFYPIHYTYEWVKWDTLLNVRIGSWKAKVVKEIAANIIIDDTPVVIEQIVKTNPGVTAFSPVEGR